MSATTRRSALGLATAIAGIAAVPALAATSPDAELIALCNRLVAIRQAELALTEQLPTESLVDEDEIEDALEQLDAEHRPLATLIYKHKRPTTIEGARAMARAALPHISKCADGSMVLTDIGEWLSVRVAEFLSGSVVA
jgi:hypothetical protein